MEKILTFHTSDLTELLGCQAHELRGWLSLPPLGSRQRRRRSATAYSPLDALFLLAIQRLGAAGLTPKAIDQFSAEIYKAVQRPVPEGAGDQIVLRQSMDGRWRVGDSKATHVLEISIPMQSLRQQLLRYTGADQVGGQSELALLNAIRTRGAAAGAGRSSR